VPYTPILGTLGYVFDERREQVLLIHRDKRPDDAHFGKFNGLGGKLEPDEDIVAGMKREIREEAGIECTKLELAGTISWPGFGKHGEDWFGFLFRIFAFEGTPHSGNDEGTLVWKRLAEVDSLSLWEGDRFFLPLVFAFGMDPFHGVMPYRDGRPVSWNYSFLPR
jgi:8-oxo-dGTP diphosphatase